MDNPTEIANAVSGQLETLIMVAGVIESTSNEAGIKTLAAKMQRHLRTVRDQHDLYVSQQDFTPEDVMG